MLSDISPKTQVTQWVIDKSSAAVKEVSYPADAEFNADPDTDIYGDTADS